MVSKLILRHFLLSHRAGGGGGGPPSLQKLRILTLSQLPSKAADILTL